MLDFTGLRLSAGLDRKKAAALFRVTERTIKAWDTGKTPPTSVTLYLQAITGKLDHLGPDWRGFRFSENCIESPEGEFVYAWEIRAMRYLLAAAGLSHTQLKNILTQDTNQNPKQAAPEPLCFAYASKRKRR